MGQSEDGRAGSVGSGSARTPEPAPVIDPAGPADRDDALWQRLATGTLVDLRTGDQHGDDPARADSWGSERDVPAALLTALLTTPTDRDERHPPVRHVRLAGARITGALDLHTAVLTRRLELRECVLVEPPVLRNAEALALDLTGCRVPGISGYNVRCRGELVLGDGFVSDDEIDLIGAHVGTLGLAGARLDHPDGTALSADGLVVDGTVFCTDGFTAHGEVRLIGARIGGQLACRNATFENAGSTALSAENLVVDHDVFLDTGFTARGAVLLSGAHITGDLICNGGTLDNPDGSALAANNIVLDQNLFATDGFTARGEVHLMGAHIGGQLSFRDGTLDNPEGIALIGNNLTVDQSLLCNGGFVGNGELCLRGARIDGQLNCRDGSFTHADGIAIDLERATVGNDVLFEPGHLDGAVALPHAAVGGWKDNRTARTQPVELRGFCYSAIQSELGSGTSELHERLRWVESNTPVFDPQPYEQLANVYAQQGNEDAARRVQIAKQRWRRANYTSRLWRWPAVAWSGFLRMTIGYGYRPWRVLWPLLVLMVTGTWLFGREQAAGRIVPTDKAPDGGEFDALRYTVDLLLPVIGLPEDVAYAAIDRAAWYAFGFTAAGWLLALVLVAGLTGILERSKPG